MDWDKYLLFNWKKLIIIIVSFIVFVIFHNLVYGVGIFIFGPDAWGPGGDEPFFFILSIFGVPLYTITSIIYTIYKKLRPN